MSTLAPLPEGDDLTLPQVMQWWERLPLELQDDAAEVVWFAWHRKRAGVGTVRDSAERAWAAIQDELDRRFE